MSSAHIPKPRKRPGTATEAPPAPRSLVLLHDAVAVPASAHSLAGFRAWATSDAFPERGRISFLGEEILIDMSAEEIATHVMVKGEVTYAIIRLKKKHRLGKLFVDRTLVTNVEANLSTEPDATLVTYESLETGRVRLVPREDKPGQYMEVEGSPDWIVEIVSDSSVRKDTKLLRERYYRAGVREYWLIDARGGEIDFHILVRGDKDFEPAKTSRGGWQESAVFGRVFRLTRQRDRLNLWEYALQVKSPR
jgi:Uma2 family endonuclease